MTTPVLSRCHLCGTPMVPLAAGHTSADWAAGLVCPHCDSPCRYPHRIDKDAHPDAPLPWIGCPGATTHRDR